ncbi:hypothetical protein Cs308_0923 [Candidatus Chlamydia sanziniae]|uniref:Uncharacterized protein n=1 Tax=Candidatus Chlamydia sanziniae TaxID=1806891 RepID=A0A1A9HYC6_9CHLA|nr:hypothetical protein Cs308_0923 [Candidatus Chlamydia sanziniae]
MALFSFEGFSVYHLFSLLTRGKENSTLKQIFHKQLKQ